MSAKGMRLECVTVDLLHCVDLGIAAHVIANILFILIITRSVLGGTNMEQRIAHLNAHLSVWYSKTKTKCRVQGKLTLERLRPKTQWPKLKAKGAATRYLIPYVLEMIKEHASEVGDDQIIAVVQLLQQFYIILENEGRFLSYTARRDLTKIGNDFGILYCALARRASEARVKLWKLSPKLHMFMHLCISLSDVAGCYINPRHFWTYADEDLVGQLIEVAESCHATTVAVSALFKWCLLIFPE